ncbi:MAG: hypothetical protein M3Q58_16870 [Bacteroidota bacterium]|nr:hypothetical protein [Bacteroidota bacterium]
MKNLFFCFLLFFAHSAFSTLPDQSNVRSLFKKAAKEEATCIELLSLLEKYNENNNPLLAGYKACATMMMANYVFNPYTKLKNFSNGKDLLEKSIKIDNNNIELRFLRFSVQTNAPSFLNYNNSIQQDKLFLMESVIQIKSNELKQLIISFLASSDYLTSLEKQNLNL